MWVGGTVYFRSDRDGEFNLYAFDPATKAGRAADRRHEDFPVLARLGRRREDRLRAGRLAPPPRPGHGHGRRASTIGVAADLRRDSATRFAKGPQWVRGGGRLAVRRRGPSSSSGARSSPSRPRRATRAT
ncbi:MAG: hypothetical protein M0C28_40380 [Candidatus Moduliflexus flocculans]|nr:hypothetical protein [Candidatus Moduliflexus flocculans]